MTKLLKQVFFIFLLIPTLLFAADELPVNYKKPIGLPTKFVSIFTKLEQKIQGAVINKDQLVLNQLMLDNFLEYLASKPEQGISRETWISTMFDHPEFAHAQIKELSAISLGQNMIVSFILQSKGAQDKSMFVLDIWQGNDENARLSIRYTSFSGSPEQDIFTETSEIPKKI